MAEENKTQTQNIVDTENEKAVVNAEQAETKAAEVEVRKANSGVDPDVLPSGEKFLAALAYISFFCILPLVMKPNNKLCQHHGKQGLILTIAFMVASLLGWFSGSFGVFLNFVHVVVAIFLMMKAVKGQMYTLPGFGDLIEKLDWSDSNDKK